MRAFIDGFFDKLEADMTIQAGVYMLKEMMDRNEKAGKNRDDFPPEDSAQLVIIFQDIIKAKNRLGKSVKKEKILLAQAKESLKAYFVTQPIDEQIRILKAVQP